MISGKIKNAWLYLSDLHIFVGQHATETLNLNLNLEMHAFNGVLFHGLDTKVHLLPFMNCQSTSNKREPSLMTDWHFLLFEHTNQLFHHFFFFHSISYSRRGFRGPTSPGRSWPRMAETGAVRWNWPSPSPMWKTSRRSGKRKATPWSYPRTPCGTRPSW